MSIGEKKEREGEREKVKKDMSELDRNKKKLDKTRPSVEAYWMDASRQTKDKFCCIRQ